MADGEINELSGPVLLVLVLVSVEVVSLVEVT